MISRLKPGRPAKFFFAISTGDQGLSSAAHEELSHRFGALDPPGKPYNFSLYSRYYDEELGAPVWKHLIGLEELRQPTDLVPIKRTTESIESGFRLEKGGRLCRRVNIDPGYVNGWQVVLASVKNYAHRIYLGQGVFAEITLVYRKSSFHSLPWTYPDYQDPEVQSRLEILRREWMERSQSLGQPERPLET